MSKHDYFSRQARLVSWLQGRWGCSELEASQRYCQCGAAAKFAKKYRTKIV
jgi:hypothetical protein